MAPPEIRPERLGSERDAATAVGSDPAASLGLTLRAAAGGSGGNGVVVTDIDPASLAADRGLEAGDVILEVAGQIVASPEDVYSALSSARGAGKRLVLMRIKSSSKTRFLAVPVS
jgi:serine protease Do